MNPILRRSSSLAVTVLATVALTLTLLGSSASAANRLADVTPQVGDCHRLDFDAQAAQSDGAEPVDCGRNHTARTFAVLDVPKGTKMNDLGALDELVSTKCTAGVAHDHRRQHRLQAPAGLQLRVVHAHPVPDRRRGALRSLRPDPQRIQAPGRAA